MTPNDAERGSPRRVLARRRHPSRDAIEGLLTAVVLALVIRHFVFEVFKIPTGSMAPTLLGEHRDVMCPNCEYRFAVDHGPDQTMIPKVRCANCAHVLPYATVRDKLCSCFPAWPERLFWRGGNRVIVNKFLCHFRPPKRWSVIVFRHPPKNLIKRLVGMPGETISIRHGDIYADGKILRKPPEVQEALWRIVYDSHFVPKKIVDVRGPTWEDERGRQHEDIRLALKEDGAARWHYRARIRDFIAYSGVSSRGDLYPDADLFPIGDLRWDVTVGLQGPGSLQLNLMEDGKTYGAVVSFGEGGAKTAFTVDGQTVFAPSDFTSDFSADVGTTHRVQFSNVDDRLELRVDGSLILAHEQDVPMRTVPYEADSNGASLAVVGAEAEFDRVRLDRDVYYRRPDPPENKHRMTGARSDFEVPSDGYFVLGDNTANSFDSRLWGALTVDQLIGEALVVWWPLDQLRPIF